MDFLSAPKTKKDDLTDDQLLALLTEGLNPASASRDAVEASGAPKPPPSTAETPWLKILGWFREKRWRAAALKEMWPEGGQPVSLVVRARVGAYVGWKIVSGRRVLVPGYYG